MGADRVCVYIPVDEYRELVRAQRDAELLKAILVVKATAPYSMSQAEVSEICRFFECQEESGEAE